jgi:hypothetical protein
VTDTQQDISVTQPKEVGAGYILVQGNPRYAMREQIANVLPFAIKRRGLCDSRMLATKNGVVGIVFNPSEWIPGSVLIVVCIAWLSAGCNSVHFLPVIQIIIESHSHGIAGPNLVVTHSRNTVFIEKTVTAIHAVEQKRGMVTPVKQVNARHVAPVITLLTQSHILKDVKQMIATFPVDGAIGVEG